MFFTYVSAEGFKCIRAFEEAFAHPILFVGVRVRAFVCATCFRSALTGTRTFATTSKVSMPSSHTIFFSFFFLFQNFFLSHVGSVVCHFYFRPSIVLWFVGRLGTYSRWFWWKKNVFFFLRNIAVIWVEHGPFGDNETRSIVCDEWVKWKRRKTNKKIKRWKESRGVLARLVKVQ